MRSKQEMKYRNWIIPALLIWLTACTNLAIAESVTIDRKVLSELTEQAMLYQRYRGEIDAPRIKVYIGANAGTYGVGGEAGVIF